MPSIPALLGTPIILSTTATALFTGTAGHNYLFRLKLTYLLTGTDIFYAYLAANSWTTGTPNGSTLVHGLCNNLYVNAGETLWLPPAVLVGTEKIVVIGGAASSFSVSAYGTDET